MATRILTPRTLHTLNLSSKHYQALIKVALCSEGRKTAEYVKPHKRKGVIERPRHFVDYIKVTVKGGSGGNGMMSFSSLPNLEWAGPDGGNGGNGGHVIFKASHNAKSLAHLKPLITAQRGVKGKTRQRDGKNAPHLTVQVPIGTVIKSENGRVLASLDDTVAMFIAARGGAGGKGNYFFLSNENRAPTMAEAGGIGQERELHVELKTMAHAGLIGFPNAGKSSLLRAISRAQPKVSPYPFTTLNPHIGMVLYDDHHQLAVADIPGLIPGSHLNKGMGHSFLRHIERCLCLVYVIDLSLDKPLEQLEQLRYELNQYKDGLADRPALLVANKLDLPGAQDRLDSLKIWMETENEKKCKSTMNKNIKGISNSVGEDKIVKEVKDEISRDDILCKESSRLMDDCHEGIITGASVINSHQTVQGLVSSQSQNKIHHETWNSNTIKGLPDHGVDNAKASIIVLGVSAKREVGISAFLHHLRVIYDSHLSSESFHNDIR